MTKVYLVWFRAADEVRLARIFLTQESAFEYGTEHYVRNFSISEELVHD